jgi:hypothetical protein
MNYAQKIGFGAHKKSIDGEGSQAQVVYRGGTGARPMSGGGGGGPGGYQGDGKVGGYGGNGLDRYGSPNALGGLGMKSGNSPMVRGPNGGQILGAKWISGGLALGGGVGDVQKRNYSYKGVAGYGGAKDGKIGTTFSRTQDRS